MLNLGRCARVLYTSAHLRGHISSVLFRFSRDRLNGCNVIDFSVARVGEKSVLRPRAAALCVGTSGGAAVSRCGAAPWQGWQLRVQGVTQLRVYL